MNKLTDPYTRLISISLSVLVSVVIALTLLTMLRSTRIQAAPLDVPDLAVDAITIMGNNISSYDPTSGASESKTIYFNGIEPGTLSLEFSISGSSPLTLSTGAAFGESERIMTSYASPWAPTVVYTLSVDAADEIAVPYVVTNVNDVDFQIAISYTRDAEPPMIATDSPTTAYITSVPNTLLSITGTATDIGSGVEIVTLTLGTTEYLATVNDDITWMYSWEVPGGDGDKYGLAAVAQDNIGNLSERTEVITLTVDNTPPSNPVLNSPVPTDTWRMTLTVPVTWTTIADGSGVIYYYLWDQTNDTAIDDTVPDVITTTATTGTGDSLPQGDNWLHLRTRDGAGNWAVETKHIGPFKLDRDPPQELDINTETFTTIVPFSISWTATDALSGIDVYNVAYKRNDQGSWTPWFTETISTTMDFTGDRGYLYAFQVQSRDRAGNWSGWISATTEIRFYALYLPLVVKPAPIPVGNFTINSTRTKDITTFVSAVTLSLSATEQPVEMKIWEAGSPEPIDWETFKPEKQWDLSTGNGLKVINARFKGILGGISTVSTQSLYLLKNGDFQNNSEGWQIVTTGGLQASVTNNHLRLGQNTYVCNGGVPLGSAQARLLLTVPPTPGYELRVAYTVYTQDHLGGPNNGLYDSFDIYINNSEPPDILREGNHTQPTNCPTWHTQQSPAGGYPISMHQYNGQITLAFANWSRYDGWYNTYTELERVWVVKK